MTLEEANALYKMLDVVDKLQIINVSASLIRSSSRLFIMICAELYVKDYEDEYGS